MTSWVAGVAGTVLLFVSAYVLRRLRIIPYSPTETAAVARANRAETELASANTTIGTLQTENAALKKERDLSSVIELVEKVSSGVDQTLAKLSDLNGSLTASARAHEASAEALVEVKAGLAASTKAVELVAQQVILKGMNLP